MHTNLMMTSSKSDILFSHGKGNYLYDTNQQAYLDFVQGWAVNCLGHCRQEVIDTLTQQSQILVNPSPGFYNKPATEFAAVLSA